MGIVGQELFNVPSGDIIREMAPAIAEEQMALPVRIHHRNRKLKQVGDI